MIRRAVESLVLGFAFTMGVFLISQLLVVALLARAMTHVLAVLL
jgi:hypothetical protein